MEEKSSYLFVYGTLLSDKNDYAVYLNTNCSYYGEGKFKGELYEIGEYPGAVLNQDDTGYVYGKIFLINKPETVLEQLDDYEGYGESQPQPNEFIRVLLDITIAGELLRCWVYLYNLPVAGLSRIGSGNYLDH